MVRDFSATARDSPTNERRRLGALDGGGVLALALVMATVRAGATTGGMVVGAAGLGAAGLPRSGIGGGWEIIGIEGFGGRGGGGPGIDGKEARRAGAACTTGT